MMHYDFQMGTTLDQVINFNEFNQFKQSLQFHITIKIIINNFSEKSHFRSDCPIHTLVSNTKTVFQSM